jgi:SPP1 gp7 family putative phage head morphogenesis protein
MAKTNKPPYPEGSIKEYLALLIRSIKAWQKEVSKLIKAALTQLRDDGVSDLIARMRALWGVQMRGIQAEIVEVFSRLNEKQRAWWLSMLEYSTGMSAPLFLALMRDDWLPAEQASRVENNYLLIDAIGVSAIVAIDSALRNGLRSGLSVSVILSEVRLIFGVMIRKVQYLARNQVEDHNAALNQLRQKDAGVPGYTWLLTSSLHPRKHHLERVGRHYLWSNPPEDGHPGTQPNCKCGAAPDWPETVFGIPVIRR